MNIETGNEINKKEIDYWEKQAEECEEWKIKELEQKKAKRFLIHQGKKLKGRKQKKKGLKIKD